MLKGKQLKEALETVANVKKLRKKAAEKLTQLEHQLRLMESGIEPSDIAGSRPVTKYNHGRVVDTGDVQYLMKDGTTVIFKDGYLTKIKKGGKSEHGTV